MCNCIDEIIKEVKDGSLSKIPKYSKLKVRDASCDLSGITFKGNHTEQPLFIPFTVEHAPIGRKTKTIVNFRADYCPFCGKTLREDT